MAELLLPSRLTLQTLPQVCIRWPTTASEVEVNFGRQGFVLPSGMVGLACLIESARAKGQEVTCDMGGCQNATYWERMGFCHKFSVPDVAAAGVRRPARSRFSELQRIGDMEKVDEITQDLVEVVALSCEARRIYDHVVSESLNNVCQHSGAAGYCLSQFFPSESAVRFCIADFGQGLRKALARFNPESDGAAILKALEVGVSGRSEADQLASPDQMRNRGVGLTAIQRLVQENDGAILIWSGSAVYRGAEERASVRPHFPWQGTLLAANLPRGQFRRSFRDVMTELGTELRAAERAKDRQRRPWQRRLS